MKKIHWLFALFIASFPSLLLISHKANIIHSELIEKYLIHDDSLDQMNAIGVLIVWYLGIFIIGIYLDTKISFDKK